MAPTIDLEHHGWHSRTPWEVIIVNTTIILQVILNLFWRVYTLTSTSLRKIIEFLQGKWGYLPIKISTWFWKRIIGHRLIFLLMSSFVTKWATPMIDTVILSVIWELNRFHCMMFNSHTRWLKILKHLAKHHYILYETNSIWSYFIWIYNKIEPSVCFAGFPRSPTENVNPIISIMLYPPIHILSLVVQITVLFVFLWSQLLKPQGKNI